MKTATRALFLVLASWMVIIAPGASTVVHAQFGSCIAGRTLGCFTNCNFPLPSLESLHGFCQESCCSQWDGGELDAYCSNTTGECPSDTYPFVVRIYPRCTGTCQTCKSNNVECTSGPECCSGICNPDLGVCDTSSPILLDVARNSRNFHLTSPTDGVAFDIGGDGVLRQVAWTQANSDVAFLALDRNGNGRIDDGTELFGDATPLSNGRRARHGFEALIDLDSGPGGADGQIDPDDPVFTQLRLWLDRNHNGISEAVELLSLDAANIVALLTDYRERRRQDQHENIYRYAGTALVQKQRRVARRTMIDVFLKLAL